MEKQVEENYITRFLDKLSASVTSCQNARYQSGGTATEGKQSVNIKENIKVAHGGAVPETATATTSNVADVTSATSNVAYIAPPPASSGSQAKPKK